MKNQKDKTKKHYFAICHLLFTILFLLPQAKALAAPPIGQIRVEPNTTVKVGQEVYFDGSDSVPSTGSSLILGKYEWDFGDGTGVRQGYPYYTSRGGGPVVTHFYRRSGVYTVTLTVEDEAANIASTTVDITVITPDRAPIIPPRTSAMPLLQMRFEDNLAITGSGAGNLNAVWEESGGAGGYVNGVGEGKAADLTKGAYIRVTDSNGILSNLQQLTISFWAKKPVNDEYGCFLEKASSSAYAAYRMYISDPRIYVATIYTGNVATARKDPLYDVQNTAWHHYVMTYDGINLKCYIDGVEVARRAHSGNIVSSNYDLIIGRRANGADIFNGYIDELKIYNKSLSPDEIAKKFELWHGDFHGRIAQYIDTQIPTPVAENPNNKLVVRITGDNGYSENLADKNNLQLHERFLLNNSKLPAGDYILTARILDATDNVLEEIKEEFEKPYDGIPVVGIDENNAVRINGKLFFPVTPWGQRTANFNSWANNYINSLYLEAFWSDAYGTDNPTIATWLDYLNQADNNDLKVMGPGRWEGLIRVYPYMKNSDPNKIMEYIEATKNHNAILAWMWGDEPDLYGVPAPVVRAWTYLCHKLDPQHLVVTNFAGKNTWVEGDASAHNSIRSALEYPYNEKWFGKKTSVVDIAGFDYYPLEWRLAYNATLAKLTIGLDRLAGENPYVPIMSFVETTDIGENQDAAVGPTPEQLRMLTWLNVVHGAKGINWFHHRTPTPPENYAVMAEFLDQITQLTPVVLGPEPERVVTDNANETGNRVDTLVREHEGNIYIFAVRLTEVTEPQRGDDITVAFNIEGIGDVMAEVFNENRTINVASGSFQDIFAPNDVHIYNVPTARPIIADHTAVDEFDQIPDYWIEEVKRRGMQVQYLGESHGRQLINGLELLEAQNPKYSVQIDTKLQNLTGTTALRVLRSQYRSAGWGGDVNGDQNYWSTETGRLLTEASVQQAINQGDPIDISIWCWCWDISAPRGASYGVHDEDGTLADDVFNDTHMQAYLNAIAGFNDNENINQTRFIYHTSVTDTNAGAGGWRVTYCNDAIRQAAINNNGILFDQADIENWNNENTEQRINTWNDSGTIRTLYLRHTDYDDSVPPNTYGATNPDHANDALRIRKAKALWWLMARLAGWDGGTVPGRMLGDVDGDGVVDYVDARLAHRHGVYTEQLGVGPWTLEGDALWAADVDGDGVVDYVDARLIARRALGLIDKFPIE